MSVLTFTIDWQSYSLVLLYLISILPFILPLFSLIQSVSLPSPSPLSSIHSYRLRPSEMADAEETPKEKEDRIQGYVTVLYPPLFYSITSYPFQFKPGRRFGEWTIDKKLDEGGFGKVPYSLRDTVIPYRNPIVGVLG